MFRRPAWPLAEVHNLDGEASVLYWDERDIDSAIAVWRHAMSYLDIYAFELVHCSLALDDEDFAEYAELRFNIGLQIAGALFSRMSTTENTVTSERDLEKKHNLRCNLGLAHLDRASSMLCTGLFEPSAEARLWFLYAKMSSMIWPANLWQAEGAIEQACALDPGMPHYEKEHNDIYVISYATETGNLGAVHEQEEDRANPQWTVFQHPDPDSPRVVYTAYRHLPENIAVALREKIANGQSDGVL